jgi:hypothetical protein
MFKCYSDLIFNWQVGVRRTADGKLASWQIGKLANWQIYRFVDLQIYRLADWQIGRSLC